MWAKPLKGENVVLRVWDVLFLAKGTSYRTSLSPNGVFVWRVHRERERERVYAELIRSSVQAAVVLNCEIGRAHV